MKTAPRAVGEVVESTQISLSLFQEYTYINLHLIPRQWCIETLSYACGSKPGPSSTLDTQDILQGSKTRTRSLLSPANLPSPFPSSSNLSYLPFIAKSAYILAHHVRPSASSPAVRRLLRPQRELHPRHMLHRVQPVQVPPEPRRERPLPRPLRRRRRRPRVPRHTVALVVVHEFHARRLPQRDCRLRRPHHHVPKPLRVRRLYAPDRLHHERARLLHRRHLRYHFQSHHLLRAGTVPHPAQGHVLALHLVRRLLPRPAGRRRRPQHHVQGLLRPWREPGHGRPRYPGRSAGDLLRPLRRLHDPLQPLRAGARPHPPREALLRVPGAGNHPHPGPLRVPRRRAERGLFQLDQDHGRGAVYRSGGSSHHPRRICAVRRTPWSCLWPKEARRGQESVFVDGGKRHHRAQGARETGL